MAIFFVLSGFVLTLGAMEKRDWHQDRSWFGPPSYPGSGEPAASILANALAEGLFATFASGQAHFNAALWTMHYELLGSMAAYATGLLLVFQKSLSRAMGLGAIALLLTATLTGEGGFYYAMLVAGVLIARVYMERDAAAGALRFLHPWRVPLVLFCDPVRRRLRGAAALWLGRLSFPVYLLHLPILLGLVAPLHVVLAARFGSVMAMPLSFALFIALTLLAAYPLARLDEWWVGRLRGVGAPTLSSRCRRCAGARRSGVPGPCPRQ